MLSRFVGIEQRRPLAETLLYPIPLPLPEDQAPCLPSLRATLVSEPGETLHRRGDALGTITLGLYERLVRIAFM